MDSKYYYVHCILMKENMHSIDEGEQPTDEGKHSTNEG